jgi:hypothetical protein
METQLNGVVNSEKHSINQMEIANEKADNTDNRENIENKDKDEEQKRKHSDQIDLLAPTDPNYNAQRTVLFDPENFTIKHPLQNRWTLWYDSPAKKTTQATWASNLRKIVTFDTVFIVCILDLKGSYN